MNRKRKWAAGIGILACISAALWMRELALWMRELALWMRELALWMRELALWMRELASWRPVTVAKVKFSIARMRVSHDQKRFLLADESDDEIILNTENGVLDSSPPHLRDFDKDSGVAIYPRLAFEEHPERVNFEVSPQKKVVLYGLGTGRDMVNFEYFKSLHYGWSKERREVYSALGGESLAWAWDDGRLKRRVRFAEYGVDSAKFSPDGKWMLGETLGPDAESFLGCFAVKNGKRTPQINSYPFARVFWVGFSPDSQFIFYVEGLYNASMARLKVIRVADSKLLWTANCSGKAKWLADGRIGFITENGLEWRDAAGRLLGRSSGPFQNFDKVSPQIKDWILSPDGKWVYSAEQSGIIRRWRAR